MTRMVSVDLSYQINFCYKIKWGQTYYMKEGNMEEQLDFSTSEQGIRK